MADNEVALKINYATLSPAEKVQIVRAMGFTCVGSDHQPDCPYAIDPGYVCNCVPPPPAYEPPDEVLRFLGESYEERKGRAGARIPPSER